MSSHDNKTEADKILRKFLDDFMLSESDKERRESALLALSVHVKEAVVGRIDDVVLFPFGTFYHGLGFKDDPLTSFVGIARREKRPKNVPKLTTIKDEISDDDDDDSSTGSILSDYTSSEIEGVTPTPNNNTWDKGRMRQTLLLNINDVLTNRENQLAGIYKEVTLTRHGKLYYSHCQPDPIWPISTAGSTLSCLLEAKSFLPVQVSRLIKFYCTLEQLFWPFSVMVLNWAKNNGVVEQVGKSDLDGLKTDHLLSLVIFFLVRRRIIPSFQLLQQWSSSQLIMDDVNIGFCENKDVVHENCQKVGIGSSGPEEWTLERLLQLLYEFFNEMASFNFAYQGISPSTGTSFSKYAQGQLTVHHQNNKRRLDTNSLICIQDILDKCQNISRKVNENWVLKFRSRCRKTADQLFSLLWDGDLLNAVLNVLEVDETFGDLDDLDLLEEGHMDNWENSTDPEVSMGQKRRCIRYLIPSAVLELLDQCYDLAEDLGAFCLGRVAFIQAVKTLFQNFLEEFNGIFWNKLVAAHTNQTSGGGDPITFGSIDPLQCPLKLSREECAISVINSLMNLHLKSTSGATQDVDGIVRFYVRNDWTKRGNDIIFEPVNKSKFKIDKLVNSFLTGNHDTSSEIIYGKRSGPPKPSQVMALVELDVRTEDNGLYVYTFIKRNESPEFTDGDLLDHCLNWYNVIIQSFIIKKFITWMGSDVIQNLDEKYSTLLSERKSTRKKARETGLKEPAPPTTCAPTSATPRPQQLQNNWNDWSGSGPWNEMGNNDWNFAFVGYSAPPCNNSTRGDFVNSRVVNVSERPFPSTHFVGHSQFQMPMETASQPVTNRGRGGGTTRWIGRGRGRGARRGGEPVGRGIGAGPVGRSRGGGPIVPARGRSRGRGNTLQRGRGQVKDNMTWGHPY